MFSFLFFHCYAYYCYFEQTPAVTVNKAKHDIPVPQIKMVETYDTDVPNNYEITNAFVRYHRPCRAEWSKAIEYVADAEDEMWLKNNTKFGGALHPKAGEEDAFEDEPIVPKDLNARVASSSSSTPAVPQGMASMLNNTAESATSKRVCRLSLPMFEHMMDLLEKATAFDAIISSGQAEHLIHERIPKFRLIFPFKGRPGVATAKNVIYDVYNYWVQKRSKLKRPLLRRFWPVTSTDDTNPHLVFRPREKEKYKLRKTRRNDMLSFNKMKQLRNDFENLRLKLDLIRRREKLHRGQIQMQCELFEQKMYDITDTSGKPRVAKSLRKRDISEVLAVPTYFDMNSTLAKRNSKRGRKPLSRSVSPLPFSVTKGDMDMVPGTTEAPGGSPGTGAGPRVVAGQNFGEPAPGFLQPLPTRESYVTSWDSSVPHVTSYIDAHALPTYRFRHRPRVGRGGRLCVDRLPCPPRSDTVPATYFTAGKGLQKQVPGEGKAKTRLLDLLPEPLDQKSVSRRIESMSVTALQEEIELATGTPQALGGAVAPGEENDGEQVLVKLEDWLATDGQLWGEERFAIGPI